MYQVEFTAAAEADLGNLPSVIAQRIVKKIRWLSENLDQIKLESLSGPWQQVFKLHVGDYRVLYTFSKANSTIIIHFIRHRREVYKMR